MQCVDILVPKDRLLRKIDAAVDFTRIYDLVEGLYCVDNWLHWHILLLSRLFARILISKEDQWLLPTIDPLLIKGYEQSIFLLIGLPINRESSITVGEESLTILFGRGLQFGEHVSENCVTVAEIHDAHRMAAFIRRRPGDVVVQDGRRHDCGRTPVVVDHIGHGGNIPDDAGRRKHGVGAGGIVAVVV